ncbi:MAG: S-layer homology domain-containing protein [Actinobacteria bacterium]|nr:S-layer homology domain-containing protein [Actinomycetota bacterium]
MIKTGRNRIIAMVFITAVIVGMVSIAAFAGVTNVGALATSQPNLAVDVKNQLAGDILVHEEAKGALATKDIWLLIKTDGVTFSAGTPAEASVTKGDIGLDTTKTVERVNNVADIANNKLIRIRVTDTSTVAGSEITIENIKYNVDRISTTTVEVHVLATEDTPTTTDPPSTVVVNTVSNAKIGDVGVVATFKPNIAQGVNNQAAGNIKVVHAVPLPQNDIWLQIKTSGVTFASVPVADAAYADLDPDDPVVRVADDLVRIQVVTTDSAQSTIDISGIAYNVAANATKGDVQVHVFSSEDTPTASTTPLSTVSNAKVVAPGEVPKSQFKDVPDDHWAIEYITALAELEIINGYPDGTFRPSSPITRAEFTKITILAAGLEPDTAAATGFSDTSGHWAAGYIATAKAEEIVNGYPDGTFRPNALITRAEITKIIIEAALIEIDTSGDGFPDVPDDHWAIDHILTAANEEIVKGYPDGTFRPNANATRAEASKMVFLGLLF